MSLSLSLSLSVSPPRRAIEQNPPSPTPPISASMEQPLPPSSTAAAAYADSLDSSPRSRNTDSWDEQLMPSSTVNAKLRLMCSYGGHIIPRPHDKSLCYVGGDTRIVVADRHTSLSDLSNRLSKTLLTGRSFTLKYQLPNEDLDSLISVTTDEDLENMIDEYDRLSTTAGTAGKSSRLRVFLFHSQPDSASSIGSLLESSIKSEDWFLDALNGSTRGYSDSGSLNCLLGLEDDVPIAGNTNSDEKGVEAQLESFVNVKGNNNSNNNNNKQQSANLDVHSVPDSPLMETRSSFGSTSSSPSVVNLPPIRVHVEDHKGLVVGGIDEQFSQMSVGTTVQKQENGVFMVMSPPMTAPIGSAAVVTGEYSNRVFSDDDRSEQGAYRKPPQAQPQPLQSQLKPTGGLDLPSPDSVSSDGSITNPLSRQRPGIYQDQIVQMPSGNNRVPPVDPNFTDQNSRAQLQQQVQDFGYTMTSQFEHQQMNQQQQQQQHQMNQQHHQQMNQQHQMNQQQQQMNQQQQQMNQQQQHQQLNPQQQQQHHQQSNPPQQNQEQQQFIQAGQQYIHHHPSGAVPMASYYPMYPPQQHPQYPFYYMPGRPTQGYNLPGQQSNYSDSPSTRSQTPPQSSMITTSAGAYNPSRNAQIPQPEAPGGVYRTATMAAPPSQVPSSQYQPQYVGFSHIQHPSQSIAPNSAVNQNYAYEFADPVNAQMYYNQALQSQMAAQYQTMTSAPTMVLPEASAQLPTDNMKQQIRTTQP